VRAAAFVSMIGLAAAGIAPVAAQAVSGWVSSTVGTHNFAQVTDRTDQLLVHCSGNAIEFAFYVDTATLDPALRGTKSAYLALIMDTSDQVSSVPGKLIADNTGKTSIGVGGAAAKELTHRIAAATRSVTASIMIDEPRLGSAATLYNRVQFSIDGAADAIRAAYDGCGIPF
jgi:hypothetical protein